MLGDQVLADQYNRELFNGTDRQKNPGSGEYQSGFLPAKLGELFYDANYHFPDPKDYANSMLAPWKGNPRTGLTSVPVLQYFD